jgi:hypothetical protein
MSSLVRWGTAPSFFFFGFLAAFDLAGLAVDLVGVETATSSAGSASAAEGKTSADPKRTRLTALVSRLITIRL